MLKYYGNYKGIILQNNDPTYMGRCKVFVPEVSMTLFKKWNEDKTNDKSVTYLGENLGGSLTPEILDRLKKALPWAHVKQPIFGLSAPVYYDCENNTAVMGNDSDSSIQHSVTNNKKNSAEKTTTNTTNADGSSSQNVDNSSASPTSSLISELLQSICSSPNENNINNIANCNTSDSLAQSDNSATFAYVANSRQLVDGSLKNNTLSTDGSSLDVSGNSSIQLSSTTINVLKYDNIASISIKFIPNTDYRIAVPKIGNLQNEQSDVRKTQSVISVSTSNGSRSITAIAAHAAPIVYSLIRGVSSVSSLSAYYSAAPVKLSFVPDDVYYQSGSNYQGTTDVAASEVVYNGSSLLISIADTPITIDKNNITRININYYDPTSVVNTSSDRLGDFANLLAEYTTPYYSTINEAVIPPASITETDDNSGLYNRGGGGSEIYDFLSSPLLPIKNLLNGLIGGSNPEALASVNHKNAISKANDPNKTVGSNLQSKVDGKPPIRPSVQNQKVKGIVSIPGIGAHVSVYFENGDPMYPVIDGVFYHQEDYKGIHDIPNSQSDSQKAQANINQRNASNNAKSTNDKSSNTGDSKSLGSSAYGNADIDPTTAAEIKNGTLNNSDQYNGAGGAKLVPNESVAYNNYPIGTELQITDNNGNPINYDGNNPNGYYRVDDTGGKNVNYKIDFYSGSDKGAYNYYSNVGGVQTKVLEPGTIANSKNQRMINTD